MVRFLHWTWVALALMASGALPCNVLPAPLLLAHASQTLAGPASAGAASRNFGATPLTPHSNPAKQKASSRDGGACWLQAGRDGDGPPPPDGFCRQDAWCIVLASLDAPARAGFRRPAAEGLAAQGLSPEQGGQTGPPRA